MKRLIIGFDVDGVIAKAPLRLDKLLRHREKGWWNKLLSTPIGKLLYRKFRHVDVSTREVLYQLRANGHQIIIATYVFKKHRSEVERWLRKNEVPFDELVLAEEKESPLEFKVRATSMEGCDYFVEDQAALARDIRREILEVRVIHYQKREDLEDLFVLL